jgi:hypothetical protein
MGGFRVYDVEVKITDLRIFGYEEMLCVFLPHEGGQDWVLLL